MGLIKQLTIQLAKRSYQVIVARNLLKEAGALVKQYARPARAVVVSDEHVAPFYAPKVLESLRESGIEPFLFEIQAGECSKNLRMVENIYHFLCQQRINRMDCMLALGGGVTGDLTGFVAATYCRGIAYIQIPTTLLAQIDASIGGKTGVNLQEGKNLVGAFWQPTFVLVDPETLCTLPEAYFRDGIAEAIKYGCIQRASLFQRLLEEDVHEFIDDLIWECINIKRQLIEPDEDDRGSRILLNFGHTVGHALEKAYRFQSLSHGQAVSIGMAMVTRSSEAYGLTRPGTYKKLIEMLAKYSLPHEDPLSISDLCSNIKLDKKNLGFGLQTVLLKEIGSSFIHTMSFSFLEDFLKGGEQLEHHTD